MEDGIEDNTFDLSFSAYTPLENPADPYSEMVESHFQNLTAYKNRNGGIWGRGELHVFSNAKLADNAIGMTHSTGTFGSERFTSRLIDSLVVGETDNIGNPTTPEEIAYGRSLSKPSIPDFPIRSYEYYDHRDEVVNTTFVNYQDNDLRKTGALSWLLFTSAAVTTESIIERAEFVNADAGQELDTIDVLRKANKTAYFRSDNALWVKLVVPEDPELPIRPTLIQASITVSR